jgi:hypothetical protein
MPAAGAGARHVPLLFAQGLNAPTTTSSVIFSWVDKKGKEGEDFEGASLAIYEDFQRTCGMAAR